MQAEIQAQQVMFILFNNPNMDGTRFDVTKRNT